MPVPAATSPMMVSISGGHLGSRAARRSLRPAHRSAGRGSPAPGPGETARAARRPAGVEAPGGARPAGDPLGARPRCARAERSARATQPRPRSAGAPARCRRRRHGPRGAGRSWTFVQLDFDPWSGASEALHLERHDREQRRPDEADSQPPGLAGIDPTGGGDRALELGQNRPRVSQERGAGRRELDPPARPDEQRKPELFLECPDLLAQRGLRDVQAFGSAAEVQLLRDGDEVTQLTKLHEDGNGRRSLTAALSDSLSDSIELNKILDTITESGVRLLFAARTSRSRTYTCPFCSPAPTAESAR